MKDEKVDYGWYHKEMTLYMLFIGLTGLISFILGFIISGILSIILLIYGIITIVFCLWPALGLITVNIMVDNNKSHSTINFPEIISLNNPKILDIGCGTGRVAIGMAKNLKNGGHIYGIDIFNKEISCNSLETVQNNAQIEKVKNKTTFQYGSATDIPFESNFFDVVNISYVLHEVDDKNKVLNEIFRVLKPEGTFYLTDFHKKSLLSVLCNGVFIVHFKGKQYWLELLENNGFTHVQYMVNGAIGTFIAKN